MSVVSSPASRPAPTFRQLLQPERPLVLPGVFDGLSARLASRAGFEAIFVGGFSVVGTRYGVPDIGLKALADIRCAVADIREVCPLPALVDIDDGYGDVKNAVNTVWSYERLGVSAFILEDQVWPKRCGHLGSKRVVEPALMVEKLAAVSAERRSPDTFVFARTDARAVHGLDDAMRRGEQYLRAGADGLFIEAPTSVDELERIGRAFDVPMIANPLEGGKTPILKPEEYYGLGFQVLPYGLHLLMRVAQVMEQALADLKSQTFAMSYDDTAMSFEHYLDVVGLPEWDRLVDRVGKTSE